MDIEEMKVEYHLAKDPKEQIRMIADQCLMKPYEVAAMLRNAGEDVDKRWFPKPQPKQKKQRTPLWQSTEIPEAPDLQRYLDIAHAVADAGIEAAELRKENAALRATLEEMRQILLPLLKPKEEEET